MGVERIIAEVIVNSVSVSNPFTDLLRTTDPIQDSAPLRRNLRIFFEYDCRNIVHQKTRK